MSATTSYKVDILPEVYDKIMWWVNRSPVEISGFGRVKFIDGIPTVISAYLVDQVNTSADTEIDDTALSKLMYQTREDEGHMNFWWHSHVNMAVFWSATDHKAIEQIGKNGWCLATVFNKKEEQRTAIYQGGSDFFPPIWSDNIDLEITSRLNDDVTKQLEEEYTAKCKAKTYTSSQFWKAGTAYCWKKKAYVPTDEAVTYRQMCEEEEADEVVVDGNVVVEKVKAGVSGKQLSLIDTTQITGTNTSTTTGDDEGVPLPKKMHSSDGYLEIVTLDQSEQELVAAYYHQVHGEWADEWWDLEEFYHWYYDDLSQELTTNTQETVQ